MTQIVLNIEDASLIPSLKKILGAIKGVTISMPQKDSYRVDPYEISPSGDTFFADSRNVKAVEEDIAKAHQPGAKFTRLETTIKKVTNMLLELQEHPRTGYWSGGTLEAFCF